MPESDVARGIGNLSGDPQVDVSGDFGLRPGSPAAGAGPNGVDMGARVPAGATISGEPNLVTRDTTATLIVGGPGVTRYRYRVNGDPWSDEISVETPIMLTGLADGDYRVEAIGRNSLGLWQAEAAATNSRPWTVDRNLSRLLINEVLAANEGAVPHAGTLPDVIELFNDSGTSVNLSGMSISDDLAPPRRYVFPEGTTIGPDEYLLVYADDPNGTSGIHVGFGLSREGEGVYLFENPARGGGLVDSVEFGLQLPNLSIGRDRFGDWTLNQPTPGAANQTVALGDPTQLRINEWLAKPDVSLNNDFVELYNPDSAPVDMGGLYLTDNPVGWPDQHAIPPLSFIAGDDLAVFVADGSPQDGPDHLNFRLSATWEMIGLFDRESRVLDQVRYGPQFVDISQGLTPNGGPSIVPFDLPNPGIDNPSDVSEQVSWLAMTDTFRYEQSGIDLGTAWREGAFDDSTWAAGPGVLFVENEPLPAPKGTPLRLGNTTYYFRTTFNVEDPAAVSDLQLTTLVDDGAVIYLNGNEIARIGMPAGEINYDTFASRHITEANFESFTIPADLLLPGENVLAGESHQDDAASSDIVFGAALDAMVRPDGLEVLRRLVENLRITEVMYNPLGGNDFEFIELQNTGSVPLDLAGVRLEGAVDFAFPNLQLAPEEYVVVVGDVADFRSRYGGDVVIAGEYDGSLSNGGEEIRLRLPEPQPVDILNFSYADAWYPSTDGRGFSLVVDDALSERADWRLAANWRASNFVNGSPGFADAGLDAGIIVVNEVLAQTSEPNGDRVELHNTTSTPLDISGWYLSDDPRNLNKYAIPAGTTVPAGGYIAFDQQTHFGGLFSLGEHGGQLHLSTPDAQGDVAGFRESAVYGAVEPEVTQGRYTKSDGTADFVALVSNTIGAENSAPRVGPVVINEIMYNPVGSGDEFIELRNITADAVSLFDEANTANTWTLGGAVDFTFPADLRVEANGYLLVVGSDPAEFRTRHKVPAEVPILGPYTGDLNDDGDDLRLSRPGVPDGATVPSILVDRVDYRDREPWPLQADGGAAALNRAVAAEYGNDSINWQPSIADGTPGQPNLSADVTPPSAPSNVGLVVEAGPRIRVTWETAFDPETEVAFYRVYRDGELIGTTATTEFTDGDVAELTTYAFEISAVNAQGLEGDKSAPGEILIISVESVKSRFDDQVQVVFTEPLERALAENVANYAIETDAIETVQVQSAVLSADGRSVTLTTSTLQPEVSYSLTINNLVSVLGHPLPPDRQTTFIFVEGLPGLTVRGILSEGTRISDLETADTFLALPPGDPLIADQQTQIYSTINFVDDDGRPRSGLFGDDALFPTDRAGADDDFLIEATGFVTIPPELTGPWTFGVRATTTVNIITDGFRLRIDGVELLSARVGSRIEEQLGQITLPAGTHTLELVYFERGGGAEVELFAAPGSFREISQTDTWRLVGDTTRGGLSVVTDPLPPRPLVWERTEPVGGVLFEFLDTQGVPGGPAGLRYGTALLTGQSFSWAASPLSPDVVLTINLRNSTGLVATATADAAGSGAAINNFPVTAEDDYVVEVIGQLPAEVVIHAGLNAALELESVADGPSNDAASQAQDIDPSSLELGAGVSRLAVRGRTDDGGDHYSFSLAAGQVVTVAASAVGPEAIDLQLLDAEGVARAQGIDLAGGRQVIRNFTPTADGTYVAVVRGAVNVEYGLVVTRGADFDLVPNDDLQTAPEVFAYSSVLGALGGAGGGLDDSTPESTPVFLPTNLNDSEGFSWDIQENGSISNGTIDAYDGGLELVGFPFEFEAQAEDGGREIVLGPRPVDNVSVTRKIFVPQDQAYARFLEIVTNTSDSSQVFQLSLSTNLGSDGETVLVGETNGDGVFSADDNWIVTDDLSDGGDDPTMTHVIAGENGQRPIQATWSVGNDQINFAYQLQLDPGETQVVMHFAAQSNSRADALEKAQQLVQLQRDALAGMSGEELGRLVNFRSQDLVDHFTIQLAAGVPLVLTTSTPDSGANGRENTLDPSLALYDRDGNLVAADDNGAADERNASVQYTATVDGRYTVRVASEDGVGEYLLRINGAAEGVPRPLSVVSSEPPDNGRQEEVPDTFTVHLSAGVDLASVEASDFFINGLAAAAVEIVDGDSLRFVLDPAFFTGTGNYAVEIPAGALIDLGGSTNEAFAAQLFIDAVAPRLVSTLWNGQPLPATRTFPQGELVFSATFDESIAGDNLDFQDITLSNPVLGSFFTFPSISYDDTSRTLTAAYNSLPEGDYELALLSADGAFEDLVGNDLDGEPLGQHPDGTVTGDGADGGQYTATFRVESGPLDVNGRFIRTAPLGSWVSRASIQEMISFPGDVDTYELHLERGETLLAGLTPLGPSGTWSLEVRDPSSRIIASQTAVGPGQAAELPRLVADAVGTYRIVVSGDVVGESFSLNMLRNSAAELDDVGPGQPLSLDDFGVDLGFERFAVQGTTVATQPSVLVWGVQPASRHIVILDPNTGNQASQFAAPGNLQPNHTQIGLAMAELGKVLMYVNADDDPTALYRLDPFTGEVLSTETIQPGPYDGLGYDGGVVFLGRDGLDLRRQPGFDAPPNDGWASGAPLGGVAGDDYGRQFAFFSDGLIHEFDPQDDTDSLIGGLTPPATDVEGLAFDGTRLYLATASGSLYALRPDAEPGQEVVSQVRVSGGALYGLAALSSAGGLGTGRFVESEPNDSLADAENIDGEFSLDSDNDIGDESGNTSTRIPHVSITGRGDDTFDFYEFTIANAGDRGIFDIDRTSNLDSYLRLYASDGTLLNSSDDSDTGAGAGGSTTGLDSYLEHTFSEPGTYYIEVGQCCVATVNQGARYELQVSIENHALPQPGRFEIVSRGETWKYLDDGSDPGFIWVVGPPLFDDSNWMEGQAEFGYGDGDERTVVGFGPDENSKFVTTYFRHTFEVTDVARFGNALQLELLRDDGAAVYLNGNRVVLDRLPAGARSDTLAEGGPVEEPEESTYQVFSIPASRLTAGTNTIAVEVHQASVTSDDLSFDLSLSAPLVRPPVVFPIVPDTDDYTVDLTGRAGSSIDVILTGQGGADFSGQTLQLLDPAGTVVATGTAAPGDVTPTNFDVAITDYRLPESGVYTIRLVSAISGQYSLLIVDDAVFDTEPNDDSTGTLRRLDAVGGAIGYLQPTGASAAEDPLGDTTGLPPNHDITGLSATVEGDQLVLSISFANSILPSLPGGDDGVFTYFELDTDQDSSTGEPAFQNQLGQPGQQGGPLGVEYRVLVSPFDPNSATVFDTQFNQVGTAPVVLTETSIEVRVPLSVLGQDDGNLNLGTIVGHQNAFPSDTAPDSVFITVSPTAGEHVVAADRYQITLQAGQTLHLQSRTPLDRSLGNLNSPLDVDLAIEDVSGTVLAEDFNSAPDGRNADLRFTATETGTYIVRVQSDNGGGEYILRREFVREGDVSGRFVFYNNSVFDGRDTQANSQDDQAIAVDKRALLPGQTATTENYTNYARGINGIMVDLPNLAGIPTLGDFQFLVGNDDQPAAWDVAPAPASITVRSGEGVGGASRVTVIWADNAIQRQWLQVTVLANATTGLSTPDVFYFGNAIGDSGDTAGHAKVDATDEMAARNNPRTFLNPAEIDDPFDFNRDARVDATDQLIARRNVTTFLDELQLISAPASVPPQPLNLHGVAEDLARMPRRRRLVDPVDAVFAEMADRRHRLRFGRRLA